jgi:hypothetical protein
MVDEGGLLKEMRKIVGLRKNKKAIQGDDSPEGLYASVCQ